MSFVYQLKIIYISSKISERARPLIIFLKNPSNKAEEHKVAKMFTPRTCIIPTWIKGPFYFRVCLIFYHCDFDVTSAFIYIVKQSTDS